VHHLPGLLYIVNYSVIAFQLAFPFLVYWPWRNDWTRAFALLGAACMHVSFLVCLNIGSFPFLSLAVLILMVPDPWIDRLLLRRRMRLQHITLYHEPRCELCQRILLVLREFLLPRSAKILSASHDPEALRLLDAGQSWAVRATDGTLMSNWRALAYILKQNPIFAPLRLLTNFAFVRRLAEKPYELIGDGRYTLVQFATRLLRERTYGTISAPALAFCAFLAALAFMSNISSLLDPADDNDSNLVDRMAAVFQVQQRWRLFAPIPSHASWHYDIVVLKADGSTVDFMPLLDVPLFDTSNGRVQTGSHLWLKYFTRYYILHAEDWDAFGSYLCRKSQRAIGPSPTVTAIDVKAWLWNVMAPPSPPDNPPLEVHFDCGET
jgi:hypothetical protein